MSTLTGAGVPRRALRGCAYPGCEILVDHGYCPKHARLIDQRRGTAAQRGYTSPEHRAWRAEVLERDVYCVDPDRRHPGDPRLAVHADHIVPVRAGGAWTLANGQGLCASCHSAKTMREQRARGEAGGGLDL